MSRSATPAGGRLMKTNSSLAYPASTTMGGDGGVSLTEGVRQLSLTHGNASKWSGPPAPTQEGSLTHSKTYQQAAAMHATAAPFTPGGASSYSGGLLPPVSSSKPTPVSMLARDSEPDGPTIVESTPKRDSYVDGFDQKVIGDGSSREHTPTQADTVHFTTDTVTSQGSRFVKIGKVEQSSLAEFMHTLQNDYQWQQKLLGQRSDHADPAKKYVTIYLCFDDIRDAHAAFDDVSIVSNDRWVVGFTLHDEYAAAPHGDQAVIARYDGQVCFEATFDDVLSNVVVPNIKDVVHNLARDFGDIIAMADVSSRGTNTVEFRVEYSKITAAREALRAVSNSPVSHQEWTIRAKPMHGSAANVNSDNVPITPKKQVGLVVGPGTYSSPSGRTTWQILADGTHVVCEPANSVAKVTYAPSDHMTSTARDRWYSEPMAITAYHADPTYQPQRASSWSANTATGPRYANTDTEPQCVRIDRISNGMDVRTTVMLRNLPNKWGAKEWKEMLDAYTFGLYDFSYLRIDFGNAYNVGYGFVNFTESKHIARFLDRWMGQEWEPGHRPEKRVQLSYATVQGYDCLVEKFRNSSIMEEFEGYRPKLWHTFDSAPSSEQVGTEKEFDAPNNRTKHQRSRDNAGHIGLYAPRSGQRGQDRARRSNFDRGTPRQLQEDAAWQAQHALFNPAFNFQSGQYVAGGPGPVGAPSAMMAHAMYGQNGYNAYGGVYSYAPQQYGAPFMPGPAAYGPGYGSGYGFAGYGPRNPASMARTISGGRLAGGRPQHVSLARDYEVPRAFNGGGQYAAPASTANGGHGYQYAGQY